ncbi:geranylgeranylglycerol-phosphate geranylgeranyltransferase [Hyperthermus butylicus]|uniref:Digeranylgeranylglyceryl phosphate synthase n=1 Tax=Hyperthermus butylicus (strain DSM 5456 / JCM 9403 / PLM1-5) TaxID=415426 RepID=DGGGP_HYPBU|nr:geranylgeranylglycerol-phosphate geranylgeranyltransferase [Hyperthermus butylicus]A2BIU7.1 RecName: Full=Digeranylgeranylglyceryl phosphate synthase; Short=DGGGP synthase; Short=DGGGPS; AltName: Full=(S)-2,3-di-O-geranylgeranylglyceryl phosphate synthase; AltName: Full=Geranylgeranylglycerol-phosphate geranylgeranyltransferase [Hyperthermus butylicus DSM 5456]ABM79903.1 polyprenyltransferase family - UbiA [Hyperthermus butylicus DSM 5456]
MPQKRLQMLRGLIELVRPHNLVVAALTTLIGYGTVASIYGGDIVSSGYAYAALIVVLVAAGGYVINDYYDIETDMVAKPWRPIVSGRVSPGAARFYAYMLFTIGLIIALVTCPNFIVFGFAVLNALLVHEYSRWIKRTGLPGNIVIAFNSASTIVFGALYASCMIKGKVVLPSVALIPVLYAFLLVLGREFVKGIEDVKGDAIAGIGTLAVRFGVRTAYMASVAVLGLVVVLSPFPYISGVYNMAYLILALVVDVLIAYSLAILGRGVARGLEDAIRASRRARSALKLAFMVGALAFLAGLM